MFARLLLVVLAIVLAIVLVDVLEVRLVVRLVVLGDQSLARLGVTRGTPIVSHLPTSSRVRIAAWTVDLVYTLLASVLRVGDLATTAVNRVIS